MTSPERYDMPSTPAVGASRTPDGAPRVGHFGMAHPQSVPSRMPHEHLPHGQGAPLTPQASYPGYGAAGASYPYQAYGAQPYGNVPGRAVEIPPEKKRKWWVVLLVALIICALVAAGVLVFFGHEPAKTTRQGTAGQLEGKTAEEIQAELDRVVDEGMFNISIANVIQFADGTSAGELRIENVPGNRYLMRVVITLDDTGEQVYETDMIEPNYHIQKDTLDVDLDAGTYAATALFGAYDMQTEQQIGQAAAKITLVVES